MSKLTLSLSFFYEFYFGLTYPITSLFLHPKTYHNPHPRGTILLVSCWFNKNLHHNEWVAYLEKKGFRTHLLHLPFMHEGFSLTAARLEKYISEHKLKNYTLVGISTAALVSLYFLYRYKRWDTIHKFISLGGPLHGTPMAWFISFTEKGHDMLPSSRFIKEVENKQIPPNKMVTISAVGDELVPQKSNYIQGVKHYIIPIWGHNNLHLSTRETYEVILKVASSKN